MPTAFMPAASATARSEPASSPSPAKPAAQSETPRYDPRTRALIEGPIVPILLRLAAPNVLVMLAQTSVGLVETYFVGMLGTDALAGVALVFPVVMLMQMMSAGAIGGGMSSAIARALGAGRRADADALALHALIIGLVFGLVFTIALILGGEPLYAAMGGSGGSLAAAKIYSHVIFSGAVLVWLFNSLANVIRGTGNMAFPALVTGAGVVVLIPLSPCLIFGLGAFPRLGVAGGAVAALLYYAIGSAVFAAYLRSGHSVVRLRLFGVPLRWPLLADILRVGAVAALITVQTNLTVAIATGLVGALGPAAIAGYGVGARLEYLLIPLVFGLGAPLVAMVGTNIGVYGLFGLGMALYFASQGAGRLLWPFLANLTRLLIAAGGGYLALRWSGQLTGVFIALAVALCAFGLINAAAIAGGSWSSKSRVLPRRKTA